MNSLFNREVKGKLCRLIYELNKDNLISIKTGTGMTRSVTTGENFSQGSIAGGSISANSLDDSIFEFFKHSIHEMPYIDLCIQMYIYIWRKLTGPHRNINPN